MVTELKRRRCQKQHPIKLVPQHWPLRRTCPDGHQLFCIMGTKQAGQLCLVVLGVMRFVQHQ
jgi:hypothetical protein